MWIKIINPRYTIGKETYKNVTVLYLNGYSCPDRTSSVWNKVVLASNQKVLQSVTYNGKDREFGIVIPDTIDEHLLNIVCNKYSKNK